jgi:integrase
MEQQLLVVTALPRLTGKGRKSRVGWEPFRTVLLIMLDSGLRPGEIFRMRWENIYWYKGLIFNPRGKSQKSRRYVPLSERVKAALVARKEGANEGWIFPSKRARSGYITDREVSKQWLEAKRLAGIPESVVLYCARHRFSTDAMEGTGNLMAVMDALGHGSMNTTRIYTHSNVRQIREAIERRTQLSTAPVDAVQ